MSTEKTTTTKDSTIPETETESTNVTTTTFKPGTIDDPNFIPGNFLDPSGNAKVIPPPPVTTVLQDFLAQVNDRNDYFLWTGANFLIGLGCQVLVIVGLVTSLCVLLPFFNTTKGMNSALPKDKRDIMRIAKRIAHKRTYISKDTSTSKDLPVKDPPVKDPPAKDLPTSKDPLVKGPSTQDLPTSKDLPKKGPHTKDHSKENKKKLKTEEPTEDGKKTKTKREKKPKEEKKSPKRK